ncbi:MAG: hypothetical protein AMJ45_01215 [Syntrophobacter sp. DG_60]|nr:MAG: hypothetical protein AMJ45_01215 [Syntrophobacter sp. DG_60]
MAGKRGVGQRKKLGAALRPFWSKGFFYFFLPPPGKKKIFGEVSHEAKIHVMLNLLPVFFYFLCFCPTRTHKA